MSTLPENDGPDRLPRPDPLAAYCLFRTRAVVLNIIVATGLLLVVSGLVLSEFDLGLPRFPERPARRVAYGILIGLVALSYVTRRVLASRSSLRAPRTRAARFYLAHVLGAFFGALAVPLGFFYGLTVRPDLQEIAPFWVAGMALGFLSLPRGDELNDFDEPMVDPLRRSNQVEGATPAERTRRRPRR